MGEPSGDGLDADNRRAAEVEREASQLAAFLTTAALPNGTTARMDPGVAGLLATAIVRWQGGELFDGGRWVSRGEVIPTPDAGDVRVETLADGAVVKMTHIPTGVVVLGEDVSATWDELKRKVADNG